MVKFKKKVRITFVITLIGLVFIGCTNKKDKSKHLSSIAICDVFWREKFLIFSGGAHSAELYSDYLTDSVNFRVYIGNHDEYSSYSYECVGDSIVVKKYKHDGRENAILSEKLLSISKLKDERIFE